MKRKFVFFPQLNEKDCGIACIKMITNYYGKNFTDSILREKTYISKNGASLLGIKEGLSFLGIEGVSVKLNIEELKENKDILPAILYWNANHFVVLYKISKNFFTGKYRYTIADPAHGKIILSEKNFMYSWYCQKDGGIALFLDPTEFFFQQISQREEKMNIRHILKYVMPYKNQMLWVTILLLLGTLTTLVFPVLTQKLIDEGVGKKNLSLIIYILLAQIVFFTGSILFNVIRNKILLFVGAKININIIADFLKKLLSLPIRFFDTKLLGDFTQRIQDHEKIEKFIISDGLSTIFSIIVFSVLFGVLGYYNLTILVIYSFLTVFSIFWALYWLKKRKYLEYFRFQKQTENQDIIYEIINGISEMKLNQYEEFKRKEWEKVQYKLFNINVRILKVEQFQISGFEFINQLKNILVTFLGALFVIKNQMTLGMLLSVSYILGQLNQPVNQMVQFFRSLQDAKLSLMRLNEIQTHQEEEKKEMIPLKENNKDIKIEKVSFQYEGPKSPYILKNINLHIPKEKITAIVGASGSGKTSLVKLLLKFYEPIIGNIYYGDEDLKNISPLSLRKISGVVMQDGFIFSDTIERNIATGDEEIDYHKLNKAIEIANIKSFIEEKPLGLKTKIGASGNGLSGGQKQRILIARAVYKNPHYIFFDEATSALDAENEKIIHDNLQSFFKGRTVIIVAHRLSTVKNADQIIVLKKGQIVEQGNHKELVSKKGEYYNLIKNQLELGT